MKITLDITDEQAEKLSDILGSHTDEGPCCSGWQSPELIELESIVDEAIENPELLEVAK